MKNLGIGILALVWIIVAVPGHGAPLTVRIAALKADYARVETRLADYATEADRLAGLGYGGPAKRQDLGGLLSKMVALQADLAALGRELEALTGQAMATQPATVASLDSRCGPIPREPEKRLAPPRLRGLRRVLDRVIDESGAALPRRMTRDQAHRYGIAKESRGVCYFTALKELFDEGVRQTMDAYRIDKGNEKAEEAASQASGSAAEAREAEQEAREASEAAEAARRKPRPPKKPSALSRFRRNMKVEEEKAEQARGGAATGAGLEGAFVAGAREEEAFAKLDQAHKDLAEANAHLAAVRARIKADEERAAREDAEFWNGFNAFMGGLGQAASEYQRPQTVPTSPPPPTDRVTRQGGCQEAFESCYVNCTSLTCTNGCNNRKSCKSRCSNKRNACQARISPPTQRRPAVAPAKPQKRRTAQTKMSCGNIFKACLKNNCEQASRATGAKKRCYNHCQSLTEACWRQTCPKGYSGSPAMGDSYIWCYVE